MPYWCLPRAFLQGKLKGKTPLTMELHGASLFAQSFKVCFATLTNVRFNIADNSYPSGRPFARKCCPKRTDRSSGASWLDCSLVVTPGCSGTTQGYQKDRNHFALAISGFLRSRVPWLLMECNRNENVASEFRRDAKVQKTKNRESPRKISTPAFGSGTRPLDEFPLTYPFSLYCGVRRIITTIREVEMYDEFGKLAGIAATIIVAGIIIYQLAINVLPWLLLVAVVCGGLYFLYFYFISSRRSEHPWKH